MPRWERPNPPRLNDTAALVQKGTHPYELKLRGEETVATAGRWTSPLETAWNPEHAFNGRGNGPPKVASGPPLGCGSVLAIQTERNGRPSPSPDKNRTVPGNGGSLAAAVNCIPKGC